MWPREVEGSGCLFGGANERAHLCVAEQNAKTDGTRKSILRWLDDPLMVGSEFLWPGRFHKPLHISTRQYARLVRDWVKSISFEPSAYGPHSMRRTKVAQIYKKTGNLRAVQLLLGHTRMDSTVRYLGVELEDALAISEAIEIWLLGPTSLSAHSMKVNVCFHCWWS